MTETPVLIAGGGPVGLVLAHELEYRGVDCLLVERNATTTRHPKMDVTNGRSMEHFRRLGLIDEIRSHGVPSDHPMTVVWVTKVGGWELARFDYPSIDWGRDIIHAVNDGTLPLEPDMRISQVILEPVLKNALERAAKHVDVRFGWTFVDFEQDAEGVTSTLRETETGRTETVRSRYLVGCDGASSATRKGLGIELDELARGEIVKRSGGLRKTLGGVVRGMLRGEPPPSGRMYMIHFTSTERDFFERFGRAWHLQSPTAGTIISQNDVDTWTIHTPMHRGMDASTIDPKALLMDLLGREIECEILVANAWQPRLCLAESYGTGRVWLAGDSAHQVVPTGGYGMNTGVGDAVDLGWKLAARLEGWGGDGLLPSYEAERRAVGFVNRAASARHLGIRAQIGQAATPAIHEDTPEGAAAREALGAKILALGNLENEALGIEIGYRYDDSPIVVHDPASTPAFDMARFAPNLHPGTRLPSLVLPDGRAVFDLLGRGFTLLRFADVDTSTLEQAAAERGLPLDVVDLREPSAQALYAFPLVLVRPDQHVAWRGAALPADALELVDRVRGAST